MEETDSEFEAKFYPIEKDAYRNKLKSVGAKLTIPERKLIRSVADPDGNSFLPIDDYFRVRDEGDLVRLSYKTTARVNGKVSDQKEIDVVVSDFEKTVRILEKSGVNFNRHQESLREEWNFKGAQITLDTWPGLLPLSEIEAKSEEQVKEIALALGFDWNKKIITGVREIFEKVYKISTKIALQKITNISFENNPFEGMKMKWKGNQ